MTNKSKNLATISFNRKGSSYIIEVIQQPNHYIKLDLVDSDGNDVNPLKFGSNFDNDFNRFNKEAESPREMCIQLIGLVCIDKCNEMTDWFFNKDPEALYQY